MMLRPFLSILLCHVQYSYRKTVVIFHKKSFSHAKRFSRFGEVKNQGLTFSQHGSMVAPTISNARSQGREDRGAADISSAFAPAQEAGARERGCRRSGNGSCAVCRWFVREHLPDCHVCGALSRSASCLSPLQGNDKAVCRIAVHLQPQMLHKAFAALFFVCVRECENPKKAGRPVF